ncbi:hypothetical protein EB796_014046 [Bugula neritina]|uniref:Uncharacterized protein n=1 Tax=Bugula neritina TaxID=10212 RepID=A0A7J7JPT7_BUGNE|nr:hypothetical protein EB796_014046 [Bugula neritina]
MSYHLKGIPPPGARCCGTTCTGCCCPGHWAAMWSLLALQSMQFSLPLLPYSNLLGWSALVMITAVTVVSFPSFFTKYDLVVPVPSS